MNLPAQTSGPEWDEAGSASEGVSFTFEAVDRDAEDALEGENLARRAHWAEVPARPGARRWLGLALFALLMLPVAPFLVSPTGPHLAFLAAGVALAVAAVGGTLAARRRLAKPIARPTRDRFTLRLTSTGLVCSGEHAPAREIELARIEAFVGDERLMVRLGDASTITLAPCLPRHDHRALAEALNRRLAEVRALRGGYRGQRVEEPAPGERVRVELAEEDAPDEAVASEAAAETRGARRQI